MTPRGRTRSGRVIVARRSRWKRVRPVLGRLWLLGPLSVLSFGWWFLIVPDLETGSARVIANDVSQLNPIPVARVAYPRTTFELQTLVRSWPGPIAIAGARLSMGGQTACEGCLVLDMSRLDHVLEFDLLERSVRVEAGMRWRALQAAIDPHGLALMVMQPYANFSVGGSLSVNAHGRDVDQGPLIRSVLDIDLVLADGRLLRASPTQNPELFYGAIGGYGGLGVIVAARLALVANNAIARSAVGMPLTAYPAFFARQVAGAPHIVFHHADLYPPAYDFVRAQTWTISERPLTDSARLSPPARASWSGFSMNDLPFGQALRRRIFDPLHFASAAVVWRNREASHELTQREPAAHRESTHALQEYFVPPAALQPFSAKLRALLTRYEVRVQNISIQHAQPDPGSLLAWARTELFGLTLEYQQRSDPAARREVARWTGEAIDAALSLGGSYYLPYQPLASLAQLRRAYPRFDEFVALKRRVDPSYRFRNTLLDAYILPQDPQARARRTLHTTPNAVRAEGLTFLTLPEVYVAQSADAYATQLEHARPSAFPYLPSMRQFWSLYRDAARRTRHRYPASPRQHMTNTLRGLGFSAGLLFESAYENTFGRVSEWFACPEAWRLCNAEDAYAAQTARAYEKFIRGAAWYEFSYADALRGLWRLDSRANYSSLRTLERRLFLSFDYGAKALWGAALRAGSGSLFASQPRTTLSWMRRPLTTPLPQPRSLVARYADEEVSWSARGQGLRDLLQALGDRGGELREIAGNDRIAVSWLAPRGFHYAAQDGELTLRWPVLTAPGTERALLFLPVARLSESVRRLEARGAQLDHVFDY
jgi:FAD/FMN-containing dehydrogenase